MNDTSSHLPVCIHCGTARPADETLCRDCGSPWIDVVISDATPSPTSPSATDPAQPPNSGPPSSPPPASGLDDTGEFDFDAWTLPPDPKSGKAKWLIPLILFVAATSVGALAFIDRAGAGSGTPVAALETATTLATTTTEAPTTTTEAPTTTTEALTTTTVPYPLADAWVAAGDVVPSPELGLRASGIGPISFGMSLAEVAGVLVASLGGADSAGMDTDLCPSPEWYRLRWGDLTVLFDGYTDDATFIAYRYEYAGSGGSVVTLETLSGIRLGDTIEVLQSTYGSYTVSFEVIEGRDHFRLLDGEELLLWGPVTGTEPQGTVEGIYSPDPCRAST